MARKHDKIPFVLIENHDQTRAEDALMAQHFPQVLAQGYGHISVYYYGRNGEDPEGNMAIVMKHLRTIR